MLTDLERVAFSEVASKYGLSMTELEQEFETVLSTGLTGGTNPEAAGDQRMASFLVALLRLMSRKASTATQKSDGT